MTIEVARLKLLEHEVRKLQTEQPLPAEESLTTARIATKFYLADKDKDGDYDGLSSTSWDGDAFSTGTGTINWNSVFEVPKGARAVVLYVAVRDSSATPNAGALQMRAKSSTTNYDYEFFTTVANDAWNRYQATVGIAPDGTTYYATTASGVGTLDIYIRVVGWFM